MAVSEQAAKYIEDGFVLNRDGRWVPLDQAIAEEDAYFRHIDEGRILRDGHWVDLQAVVDESPGSTDAIVDQDTRVIDLESIRQAAAGADSGAPADGPGDEPSGSDNFAALAEPVGDVPEPEGKRDTVRLEIDLAAEDAMETRDTDRIAALGGEIDTWGAARGRHRTVILVLSAASALVALGVFLVLRVLA
ncbi:MAG: hypothetical protein GF418_13260 [Chitinivibrionales bacterium]|nr:hypothetical protein [Chitinivibrionales bacterium]MBD3396587.1 hypothetical protein [Chitinivibrionales bacterium]